MIPRSLGAWVRWCGPHQGTEPPEGVLSAFIVPSCPSFLQGELGQNCPFPPTLLLCCPSPGAGGCPRADGHGIREPRMQHPWCAAHFLRCRLSPFPPGPTEAPGSPDTESGGLGVWNVCAACARGWASKQMKDSVWGSQDRIEEDDPKRRMVALEGHFTRAAFKGHLRAGPSNKA